MEKKAHPPHLPAEVAGFPTGVDWGDKRGWSANLSGPCAAPPIAQPKRSTITGENTNGWIWWWAEISALANFAVIILGGDLATRLTVARKICMEAERATKKTEKKVVGVLGFGNLSENASWNSAVFCYPPSLQNPCTKSMNGRDWPSSNNEISILAPSMCISSHLSHCTCGHQRLEDPPRGQVSHYLGSILGFQSL